MASKRIKLTKKGLADAPLGDGWIKIDDQQVPGLKLFSGKTIKSIYLRRRINGQNRDFKLCRWEPNISPDQIRNKAIKAAAKLVDNIDINAERRTNDLKAVTLDEAYQEFVKVRSSGKNPVKASTKEQWAYGWTTDLKAWASREMLSITASDVQELHEERSKSSPSRANFAVRLLSQIFRVSMATYEDENHRPIITYDPTQRISALKLQNKIDPRTGHIPADKLEDWFEAVATLSNEATRDLLVFTLMTGLRKNEAGQLEWDRVDLKAKTYTIVENKANRPVTLPLSDYFADMLTKRKASAGTRRYVFPAGINSGYLKDWRWACGIVSKHCGVTFTPHDLRRTFITIAESLDTPIMVLKMMVNHALPKADVTSGYVQMDVERMRGPFLKINDFILQSAGLAESAKVVQIKKSKAGRK